MRWNDKKSRRFQELREIEAQKTLTDAERVELNQLLDDLDADEADDLRLAMEQAQVRTGDLAAEKEQLDAHAAALARIVAEQQGLLTEATRPGRSRSATGPSRCMKPPT